MKKIQEDIKKRGATELKNAQRAAEAEQAQKMQEDKASSAQESRDAEEKAKQEEEARKIAEEVKKANEEQIKKNEVIHKKSEVENIQGKQELHKDGMIRPEVIENKGSSLVESEYKANVEKKSNKIEDITDYSKSLQSMEAQSQKAESKKVEVSVIEEKDKVEDILGNQGLFGDRQLNDVNTSSQFTDIINEEKGSSLRFINQSEENRQFTGTFQPGNSQLGDNIQLGLPTGQENQIGSQSITFCLGIGTASGICSFLAMLAGYTAIQKFCNRAKSPNNVSIDIDDLESLKDSIISEHQKSGLPNNDEFKEEIESISSKGAPSSNLQRLLKEINKLKPEEQEKLKNVLNFGQQEMDKHLDKISDNQETVSFHTVENIDDKSSIQEILSNAIDIDSVDEKVAEEYVKSIAGSINNIEDKIRVAQISSISAYATEVYMLKTKADEFSQTLKQINEKLPNHDQNVGSSLAAIRNIKHRYGITGDSENIFRREKIVSAEENRIC